VCRPIQARHPVGYNRDFLNNYRPNETHYLSEKERNHLLAIGKSPDSQRPAGTYARQIFNRLLIDLSWNSSRLEGNTYSLLETERLLQLGEASEGKNRTEAQMILNHKAAIEFMVESANQMQFNNFTIFNLHALLSDNLLHDPRACGCLRLIPVGIAKSVYQPLTVPQLISEYFEQILDTAQAITDPFEQSFFVMVHLPYLQPFLDVNKRTSRLAANIPFICQNLCPLSFVDVPEQLYINALLGIYELNRVDLLREVFVWAYERSCFLYSATRQELGEPDLFRLRYRNLIITTIGEIIRKCMDKRKAVAAIKKKANEVVPKNDLAKFIEVVETELMSLHKGNIARFRLKPAEYDLWIKTWH
jgi:Fic family protein